MAGIMDIYKCLNSCNSIVTVVKNSEMLKLVPHYLKTKNMCKRAVIKLSYLLGYVPDQHKTQNMCDKAVNTCSFTIKSAKENMGE